MMIRPFYSRIPRELHVKLRSKTFLGWLATDDIGSTADDNAAAALCRSVPGKSRVARNKNGAGPTVVPGDELRVFVLNHLEELDDKIGRRLRPSHGDGPVAVSGKHT